ncbi:hypothetical protein [Pseudoalteromonas umbrosa]|uniref:hypothetical protein n=1 Tax=Pseudoalteromonas umbrosa TaxID=3048489 RepID=UPI0024C386B2|nr:hypothetical protein [Pseudoalteromonas sp. B95]MDK1288519.1 hypothetical protein [Pseudoalteromonas sp. B95]
MNISKHRSAYVYLENDKITVWVCPDNAGFDKGGKWLGDLMEDNSLYLHIEASKENWYKLHRQLRQWFSPVTVECS